MVSSFFSTTPGFYCFKEFKYAFKYLTLGYDLKRECILKVLVKKGTKVKYGNCLSVKYWGKEWQYTHLESVLVEELTPVEVCTSDI